REDRRGAGVRWVGGCGRVVDAAAESVAAAIASLSPIMGQRAARDGDDAPQGIRNPAPQRGAAVAADGLVMRNRAIAERDLAARGFGDKRIAAISREPTTDARVHESAGRVAVAADGAVVADRHVAEGQDSVLTR